MILEYITAALEHARYEIIEDAEPYYGEVLELPGVSATGKTLEECRRNLAAVIDERLINGSGAGSRSLRSPAAPWERIRPASWDRRVKNLQAPGFERPIPQGKHPFMVKGGSCRLSAVSVQGAQFLPPFTEIDDRAKQRTRLPAGPARLSTAVYNTGCITEAQHG